MSIELLEHLARKRAASTSEPILEARDGKSIARGLRVTIDEMSTDPGLRSGKGVSGRSADNYISNLRAHAKEIESLGGSEMKKVARSIRVTTSYMVSDISSGKIYNQAMETYIQNLKADLSRVTKGIEEDRGISEWHGNISLSESVSRIHEDIPTVGQKVTVNKNSYRVQDVNTSDFSGDVLLVKLGDGRLVSTYGFDVNSNKWMTPLEVTSMRTQAHDMVDDGCARKTEEELLGAFTDLVQDHFKNQPTRRTMTGYSHRAEESVRRAEQFEDLILTEGRR